MTESIDMPVVREPAPRRKKATSKRLGGASALFQPSMCLAGECEPFFVSDHGALFDGDCLEVLPKIKSDCIDTVFADPPFNLDKKYGAKSKDNLPEEKYVAWCKAWLDECTPRATARTSIASSDGLPVPRSTRLI